MGNMMVYIVRVLFEGCPHYPFEVACGQEQPGNPASQTSPIVQGKSNRSSRQQCAALESWSGHLAKNGFVADFVNTQFMLI